MHNGKRWFLNHYKLCVLRKFGFNLNIQCSFAISGLEFLRQDFFTKVPLNQPRDIFSGNDHSKERHPVLTENVQRGVRRIGDCGMPESREKPRSALFLHRRMEECKSILYC